jgi:hypothetical protein
MPSGRFNPIRSICGRTLVACLVAVAGCSSVRVRVDARAAGEPELRERLLGPKYVIRGPDEQMEGSLAFQEYAATLDHALALRRPDLERVGPAEPADFAILVHVAMADLGAGVTSYPVYGSHYGRAYGPCGPGYYHSFGVVGTEVRSVHYGYDHALSATAYVQDPAGPGGRRVLWEGTAGVVSGRPDLTQAMPYLALALTSMFGQSSEGTEVIKFSSRDEDVKILRRWIRTGVRPMETEELEEEQEERRHQRDGERGTDEHRETPGGGPPGSPG